MTALHEARQRVREIDAQILRLVAQRLEHAREIGRLKKLAGVPLRDWDVERAVLAHAEATAGELGLSRPLVRGLMQMLVGESRRRQERESYASYSGDAESVLVIGGRGRMGRWLCEFFADQGHRVRAWDIADPKHERPALDDLLRQATFTAVAASLETVPQVIDELAQRGCRGLVFDIASLKGHLKGSIGRARAAGLSITSIHPMFGPGTQTLSDQVICLCDCGDAEATRRVRALFAETAASLVELSLDEHDRLMGYVLGLSHLMNVLFVRVLMGSGGPLERLTRVGSTTFHSQMQTTGTVIRDDPELYYAIQRLNPFTPQLYADLGRELEALTGSVLRGDRAAFVRAMQAARAWVEQT